MMRDIDAVALLKQTFDGMSKSIYSMTKRPDKYGIELTKLAQAIVHSDEKRKDNRRKPYRITFRLSYDEFEQFELARGNDTRQQFCEAIVKDSLGI